MSIIMVLTIVMIVCGVIGAGAGFLKEILKGKEDYLEELSKEPGRRARREASKPMYFRKNGKLYKMSRK